MNKFSFAHFIYFLSLVLLFSGCSHTPPHVLQDSKHTSSTDKYLEVEDGLKDQVRTKLLTEENKKEKYSINIAYPEVYGISSAEKVNEKINEVVSSTKQDFVKSIIEWNKEDVNKEILRQEEQGSYFEMSFKPFFINDNLISLYFYIDTYYAGAAHPTYNYTVLNYKVDESKEVLLKDLFKPGSNYLQKTSTEVINDLSNTAKAQSFMLNQEEIQTYIETISENDAAPKEENFKNFTFNTSSLFIFFDDGAVTAHAVGGDEGVEIPWKKFETILDQNGPLKLFK